MEQQNSLNFDLVITPDAPGSYRAQVIASPVGQVSVSFSLPFSQAELDNLVMNLSQPAQLPSGMDTAKDFGWKLFTAVFKAELETCLRNSLTEAGRQGKNLRLRLNLNAVPDLVDLPWEYLYYLRFDAFLALLKEITLVRHLDLPQNLTPLSIEPPLKMLVMISNPAGYPAQFDTARQWSDVNNALTELQQNGLLELKLLPQASLSALQQELSVNQYQILQLNTQGYFDREGNAGWLLLEDNAGQSQPASSQQFAAVVREQPGLRLVLLNDSKGAVTLSGIAQHLVVDGVPAVVATQYESGEQAANILLNTFYGALAQGQPIDSAITEARRTIYRKGHDLEWGTAPLYLGATTERLFEIAPLSSGKQLAALSTKAQTAFAREDWAGAISGLEEIVALDPANTEGQTQLAEARRQQTLSELYQSARRFYEAAQWCDALQPLRQLQEQAGPAYKDLATLLQTSQEKCSQLQLADFYNDALDAMEREEWASAVVKLEEVLALDPAHEEATANLVAARHHHELATLYQTGREHYDAGRWCEAAETFRQLDQLENQYRDVRSLLDASEMECQRLQLGTVQQEAEDAIAREDWAVAAVRLETLLTLNPLAFDARDKLAEVKRQQEAAALYARAQAAYQAERWDEATQNFRQLQTQMGNDYKDVTAMLARIQTDRATAEQRAQLNALYAEVQTFMANENWPAATEKLKELQVRDPEDLQVNHMLVEVRRQQELTNLYKVGHEHYEANRWREALKYFRQTQQFEPEYKDVEALIKEAEDKLTGLDVEEQSALNFDVQIDSSVQGYRFLVLNSPVGQASTNFKLPFSQSQLETLLTGLSQPAQLQNGTISSNTIKDFGWQLFNAVVKGSVHDCLQNSLAEANRLNKNLCVRLDLSKVPELISIPWEYLYYPAYYSFLALLKDVTLLRYTPTSQVSKPLHVEPPLRVLVMVASPQDYPWQFDTQQEWNRLNHALSELQQGGLVSLELLQGASFSALETRLKLSQFHMFHFIGQAYLNEESMLGELLVEDNSGYSFMENGTQLTALLRQYEVKLAIIQAGEGASIVAQRDPFLSVSQTLITQGLASVVALPYGIEETSINAMLGGFYSALAQGQRVDSAIAEARNAVYRTGNEAEWGEMTLYLSIPGGRIFEVAALSPEQQAAALYRKALAATERQEWNVAVERLKAIIALDPSQAGVLDRLEEARTQQEISNFYAAGRKFYDAGQWCEALTPLNQLKQLTGPDYKDLLDMLLISEERCQASQLDSFMTEASAAYELGDWTIAIEKLTALLALDPSAQTVARMLEDAKRQQELEQLYKAGRDHYQAARWAEALELFRQIQTTEPGYRDVTNLSELAQLEVGRAQKRNDAAVLNTAALNAVEQEDWPTAYQKIDAYEALEPADHAEEANRLRALAREREDLAFLYANAQGAYQGENFNEALDYLHQIQARWNDYKDVPALIAEIEGRLSPSQPDPFSYYSPPPPDYPTEPFVYPAAQPQTYAYPAASAAQPPSAYPSDFYSGSQAAPPPTYEATPVPSAYPSDFYSASQAHSAPVPSQPTYAPSPQVAPAPQARPTKPKVDNDLKKAEKELQKQQAEREKERNKARAAAPQAAPKSAAVSKPAAASKSAATSQPTNFVAEQRDLAGLWVTLFIVVWIIIPLILIVWLTFFK